MILDDIVRDKKKRLAEEKQNITEEEMKRQASASTRNSISFFDALSKNGLSIIGEFKKASPSMGIIDSKIDLSDRIEQYSKSVDAISCLTEEDHFNGSAEYLKKIRQMTELPILRKDFIIDKYQIYESKVIGADAILLIAAILSDDELKEFYLLAKELNLDVLLEVHDREEMERAINIKADIIGVNNRNLKDFSINLETTGKLRKMASDDNIVFVSESGILEDSDIKYLKECRVDGVLIGRAFMEAESPKQLAEKWKKIYEDQN